MPKLCLKSDRKIDRTPEWDGRSSREGYNYWKLKWVINGLNAEDDKPEVCLLFLATNSWTKIGNYIHVAQ